MVRYSHSPQSHVVGGPLEAGTTRNPEPSAHTQFKPKSFLLDLISPARMRFRLLRVRFRFTHRKQTCGNGCHRSLVLKHMCSNQLARTEQGFFRLDTNSLSVPTRPQGTRAESEPHLHPLGTTVEGLFQIVSRTKHSLNNCTLILICAFMLLYLCMFNVYVTCSCIYTYMHAYTRTCNINTYRQIDMYVCMQMYEHISTPNLDQNSRYDFAQWTGLGLGDPPRTTSFASNQRMSSANSTSQGILRKFPLCTSSTDPCSIRFNMPLSYGVAA